MLWQHFVNRRGLLRTDAGRAVTTSVYGPVSTMLLQYLCLSFIIYLHFPFATIGYCIWVSDGRYCCNVNCIHQKSYKSSYDYGQLLTNMFSTTPFTIDGLSVHSRTGLLLLLCLRLIRRRH